MQAYYEIETQIPGNHQLNIQLTDNPEGGLTVEEIQAYIDDERASAKILSDLGGTEPQLDTNARRQQNG